MKIPQTFILEKDLENKILQLLEEEKSLNINENYQVYKKLFGALCTYLHARTTDWKGIIYINDHYEKNRYQLVKDMLKDITENKLNMPCKWELQNFFGKLEDKELFNKLYQAILYEKLDESSMYIIYTSSHMTDGLAEDITKWQMLMANAIICPISEPEPLEE